MQKKFLSGLILVLVLNLLIKPFYILGIDAEILKQVELYNPGDYGMYFSLLGLTFVVNIFLDLGIINFNTRNIAQNSQLIGKHFSSILSLRLLLAVLYIIVILLLGLIFQYNNLQLKILSVLGINQVFVAFILYFRSNLSALLRFKEDSLISVLDRALLILVCSFLLWGGITNSNFKIEWFIYAQTFSYAFTALIGLILVLRQTGRFKLSWDRAFNIVILKKSFPYALLILLMAIYYYCDAIMLERLHPEGKIEAASYARGFRFFMAANMIGYLFAGVLLPIFSKMLKNKNDISNLVYLSFKLIFGISVIIGVLAYLFKAEIINLRYDIIGNDLAQCSSSFGFLMLAFIAACTTYIFGTLLTASGKLKSLNIIAICGVLINILMNVILIPKYGAEGAAFASFVTQGITAILQVIIAFKILNILIIKKELFMILIFSLIAISTFYWHNLLTYDWLISFIIVFAILLISAFITGMISVKKVLLILKEK